MRQLKANINDGNYTQTSQQLKNLRRRVRLITAMQALGVLSIIFCTFSMTALFYETLFYGYLCFGTSLLFMIASLIISFWEILISANALNVELREMDKNF